MLLRLILTISFLALLIPSYLLTVHLHGPYNKQTDAETRSWFIASVFFAFIAVSFAALLLSVLIFWNLTGRSLF